VAVQGQRPVSRIAPVSGLPAITLPTPAMDSRREALSRGWSAQEGDQSETYYSIYRDQIMIVNLNRTPIL
jgi:hypothetical protein